MKKIISLLLVLLMVFGVTACNGNTADNEQETVPLDIKELKENWKLGTIVFANGGKVLLPCPLNDFLEASGLEILEKSMATDAVLKANKKTEVIVGNDTTRIRLTCSNTTEDRILMESMVTGVLYNHSSEGNRDVKFAGTLSPGAAREQVEMALGTSEKVLSDNMSYVYEGRNQKNNRIKLIVFYNSENLVRSVSYEIL